MERTVENNFGFKRKTASGLSVRVLCVDRVDRGAGYTVVALTTGDGSHESVDTYTANGQYFADKANPFRDLIPIRQPPEGLPFFIRDEMWFRPKGANYVSLLRYSDGVLPGVHITLPLDKVPDDWMTYEERMSVGK